MERRGIIEGRAWKRQELGRLTTCMIAAMYSAAFIGCGDAFAVLPCNTEEARHRMFVKNTGPVPSARQILRLPQNPSILSISRIREIRSIATCCQQAQGLVLSEPERGKDNPAPDEYFYDYPRICYHADNAWHAQLTKVYEEYLPYGDDLHVLDLMTSAPLPLLEDYFLFVEHVLTCRWIARKTRPYTLAKLTAHTTVSLSPSISLQFSLCVFPLLGNQIMGLALSK